jgi:hypothetical protein
VDPYRDDRDARIEELQRRLVAAESALRLAETKNRKLLRTTIHGSALAVWFLGSLSFAAVMIVAAIGGAGTVVHAVGAILSAGVAFLVAVATVRSAADEILVVRERDGELRFVDPGDETAVGRRRVKGALPAGRVRVDVALARHAVTAYVSIGADVERRRDAVPRFLDATLDEVAAEAKPIVEAAARKVLAQRGDGAPLDRASAEIKLTVQSALRDLGLEIGDLLLVPVT